jgi:hypothetical protein
VLFESFRGVLLDKYGLAYLSGGTLPGAVIFSQRRIQATVDLKGVKIGVPTTGAAR